MLDTFYLVILIICQNIFAELKFRVYLVLVWVFVCVFFVYCFGFFKDYSFFPFSSFSAIHLFFIKSQNNC